MKKRIKKRLIIGGAAIVIAVSSIGAGFILAEKIIGPSDDNDKLISGIEKANIEAQQHEREQQNMQQGIEEAKRNNQNEDI